LFATLLEAGVASHHRHHPAHAGRTGDAFHVQFPIQRAVALMAVRAEVITSPEANLAQRGHNLFDASAVALCRVSTPTGYLLRFRGRHREQMLQSGRAGAVHRGAHQHLYCFQIHFAAVPAAGEDHLKQAAHLPFRFPLNRFGRFFSRGVSVSSTGRKRQICSLTSTSSWLSRR